MLCPGGVNTSITGCERNRPAEMRDASAGGSANPVVARAEAMLHQLVASGVVPSEVAGMVLEAMRDERSYFATHADWKEQMRKRMVEFCTDETSAKRKINLRNGLSPKEVVRPELSEELC